MTLHRNAGEESAGIQYAGEDGDSQSCQDAITCLIQGGQTIGSAAILTTSTSHALLLRIGSGELVAVKSGFASGYAGEGPRRFSLSLQILRAHGVEIEEYDVPRDLMERLGSSALTLADLEQIESSRPLRPRRWDDYVLTSQAEIVSSGQVWGEFPLVVPFAIVDSRLMDLAISFSSAPDESLLSGYRRLEDIVRRRTGLESHGAKLFSQALLAEEAPLRWVNCDPGEHTGRANLFIAAFRAHRNPRAHREESADAAADLSEFLLLNHLYRLEAAATCSTSSGPQLALAGGR